MFRNLFLQTRHLRHKNIVASVCLKRSYQVTVVGSAGGAVQPLALMLKTSQLVSKVVLYDSHKTSVGLALDLNYVPSNAHVKGYVGEEALEKSLDGANIVIVADGAPRTKGVTDDQLLKSNASVVAKTMQAIVKICPCAFVIIMTQPINSLTSLAAEALRWAGSYDERKLFGLTNATVVRAQVEYAKAAKLSPVCTFVPVIGGDSEATTIPLFSQSVPCTDTISADNFGHMVKKVRCASHVIEEAKGGSGEGLSAGYAAFMFLQGLLEAMAGNPNIQYAYTQNNDFGTCFFAAPVLLDGNGVFETQMVGTLNKLECELLEVAIDLIRKDVLKGQVAFSEIYPPKHAAFSCMSTRKTEKKKKDKIAKNKC